MAKENNSESAQVRIDKWLWAARFFKTRSLAIEAINGGHVHLNGARTKPSRALKEGDELRITKGQVEFVVTVLALADKRGPATVAQTLYQESEASLLARQEYAEQRKLMADSGMEAPHKRPNKRDRRHIIRFTRRQD